MDELKTIQLTNGTLVFALRGKCLWSLATEEIRVIIEYTTEEGPFAPDHFIAFIDRSSIEYHLPLDAQGCLEILDNVGQILAVKIELRLTSLTEFSSRVLFPESISGAEGYYLKEKRRSIFHRLLVLGQETEMILTEEVQEVLN